MQFGVFDHMDASGSPLAQFFENRLKLAEAYDRLGLHALHVAEHTRRARMSPSPSVSSHSRRSAPAPSPRSLVYTLPLHHPLRLARRSAPSTS